MRKHVWQRDLLRSGYVCLICDLEVRADYTDPNCRTSVVEGRCPGRKDPETGAKTKLGPKWKDEFTEERVKEICKSIHSATKPVDTEPKE